MGKAIISLPGKNSSSEGKVAAKHYSEPVSAAIPSRFLMEMLENVLPYHFPMNQLGWKTIRSVV